MGQKLTSIELLMLHNQNVALMLLRAGFPDKKGPIDEALRAVDAQIDRNMKIIQRGEM